MLGGLLITFREGLEAFLVLGIILSYLSRADLKKYNKWIYCGAILGLFAAFLTGIVFQFYYNGFESKVGELYLKVGIMGFAVVILTYMVIWMKNNSKNMKGQIEQNLQKVVTAGSIYPLVFMGFLAVLREGFETVLFLGALYGDAMSNSVFYGSVLGLITSALVTTALFKGMKNVPLKTFFKITSGLIIIIAAGLLNNMVGIMQDIHIVPTFVSGIFNLGWLLNDSSEVGILFKALFGYTHSPSLLQFSSYLGYLALVTLWLNPIRKPYPIREMQKA